MRYLLDANIVSDLVRNPQGRVAERIRKIDKLPFPRVVSHGLLVGLCTTSGVLRLYKPLLSTLTQARILLIAPDSHIASELSRLCSLVETRYDFQSRDPSPVRSSNR